MRGHLRCRVGFALARHMRDGDGTDGGVNLGTAGPATGIERAHQMAKRMRDGSARTRPGNVGLSHIQGDGPTEPPPGLSLQQQNAWFEANPGAASRFLAKIGDTFSAR